jgi:prepilin-type N-terminal cleavage/methylation domain-containing protein
MTRHGVTLIELLVVVTLLGVLAAVVAFTASNHAGDSPRGDAERLAAHRRAAVVAGVAITVAMPESLALRPVTFLPDGQVVGAGIDPITPVPR